MEPYIRLQEITRLDDPLLLPWLELYETAFLPEVRILVADYIRILQNKACGRNDADHLVAALDEKGEFVGLAHYADWPDLNIATAWYLAVVADRRNQGIGMSIHDQMAHRVEQEGRRAFIFEVEIPEDITDPDYREFIVRKIARYRRHGARMLRGISYIMHLGEHQPEMPMDIMVHPFSPMTAEEAFALVKGVFGEQVMQVGELELV